MQYRILFILTLFSFVQIVNAQEDWLVPEDKKAKLSPFEFTEDIEKKGQEVYSANCASCHGTPGENNFVALSPPPGDPGSVDFQMNSDGELYHKVREGRGTMPSFKNTLTPDDVWAVISYIRSGNADYVQEVAKEIQRGAYAGEIDINLEPLDDNKSVKAVVIGTNNNTTEFIEGAAVKLSVTRLFGNMQVGEEGLTNKNGEVIFTIEDEINGDSTGNIELIAQLSDQEAFGVIEVKQQLSLGKPTYKPSLVAERAMWNKVQKAPVWILFSYLASVLGVWGIIFYVFWQIKHIYAIGKESE